VEIIRLYHEHWEIETAFAELKSTTLGGRRRAPRPAGVDQEIAPVVHGPPVRVAHVILTPPDGGSSATPR
jgi:hypothetical protein